MIEKGKFKCKICGNIYRIAGYKLHMQWAHGLEDD
jgi:hypothetical protein